MTVIYLNHRKKLTEEQKQMATSALNNEINEVMANMEIFEESLDRTFLFSELQLRKMTLDYMNQRLKQKSDGGFDDELLHRVYEYYFGEQ